VVVWVTEAEVMEVAVGESLGVVVGVIVAESLGVTETDSDGVDEGEKDGVTDGVAVEDQLMQVILEGTSSVIVWISSSQSFETIELNNSYVTFVCG